MDDEEKLQFLKQFNGNKLYRGVQKNFVGFGNAKFGIELKLRYLIEHDSEICREEKNDLIMTIYGLTGFMLSKYIRNNVSVTWNFNDPFVDFINKSERQVFMLAYRIQEFFDLWYEHGNPGLDSEQYKNIETTLEKLRGLDDDHIGFQIYDLEKRLSEKQ